MTRCVAIDWSGARHPRGKLVLAEARGGSLVRLESFDAREPLIDAVCRHAGLPERVVIGIDFSFSLPAWFCRRLEQESAFALWARVEDEGERWLRDCAWPFWGRPGKKRPELERHYRRTEEDVGATLGFQPKSTFQIGGAGAVGTGSLRGMPLLSRCRAAGLAVWPFDEPARQTVIEIYPRALTGPVVKSSLAERKRFMQQSPWQLPARQLEAVVSSEDSFDAAVSALVMDRHAAALGALPRGDRMDRLEGRIWVPDGPSTGSRPARAIESLPSERGPAMRGSLATRRRARR